MKQALAHRLSQVARILLYCGGIIVLIQAAWISYGVFMRYALNSPDGVVTEATALLLVPVAFFGLAYALHQDAYPKVTLLRDHLPAAVQAVVDRVNLLIMTLTGAFFALAACEATYKAYYSGAASEILLWPRFYFWIPVAISLVVFTLFALIMLLTYEHPAAKKSNSANTHPTAKEAH